MKKALLKLLTLFFILCHAGAALSTTISQKREKTHLRWEIASLSKKLEFKKIGKALLLKTLDSGLFTTLANSFRKINLDKRYVQDVKVRPPDGIEIELTDDNVEVFTFYSDRNQKHMVDFWREKDEVVEQKAAVQRKIDVPPANPVPVVSKISVKKEPVKPKERQPRVEKDVVVKERAYRDFRYGSAFYWDYKPLSPGLEKIINLESKTPEYFYPVRDRDFRKSDKESHLQLSINMFKKKKWGLMYKSIKLYQEKYGVDDNFQVNEYLKANAILRDGFEKGKRTPAKLAINMLKELAGKSHNYYLKKAIVKYLLVYNLDKKDHVEAFKLAKKLYVISKEKSDIEEIRFSVRAIFFGLSQLNQIEDLTKVLQDKSIVKEIPKQLALAYKIYSYMRIDRIDDVIKIYENKKVSLAKPIHESIIFNVAESYFRKAEFAKGVKLFDEFIKHYSYHPFSSKARVRLALSYEIMDKEKAQTAVLYRNAINRSGDFLAASEAKIRYVGLLGVRKNKRTRRDREMRVFLKLEEENKKRLSRNLKKLLWLTRLRIFIVDKEYENALAYLKAIPLSSLNLTERRVFESDGAEIVYGIVNDLFEKSEYSKVVKVWNQYKDKYISKVANDPRMNFIVGKSYLKIGLYDAFDKIYQHFSKIEKTPNKTFPLWVSRKKISQDSNMAGELLVIKHLLLDNLKVAQNYLDEFNKKNSEYNKSHYYQGVIFFKQKKLSEAIKSFETFLSNQKTSILFDPNEMAELMIGYTESLYQMGKVKKFERVSKALLEDTKAYSKDNNFVKKAREKISYFYLETLSGRGNPEDYLKLESESRKFKKDYSDSIYFGRVNYLLGTSYVKNKKIIEARKIFKDMLKDKKISSHIKKLAKSELAMLAIKEKTL